MMHNYKLLDSQGRRHGMVFLDHDALPQLIMRGVGITLGGKWFDDTKRFLEFSVMPDMDRPADESPTVLSEAIEIATDRGQKIQFLIDYMYTEGLLEEDTFTFPDGETWDATKEDPRVGIENIDELKPEPEAPKICTKLVFARDYDEDAKQFPVTVNVAAVDADHQFGWVGEGRTELHIEGRLQVTVAEDDAGLRIVAPFNVPKE